LSLVLARCLPGPGVTRRLSELPGRLLAVVLPVSVLLACAVLLLAGAVLARVVRSLPGRGTVRLSLAEPGLTCRSVPGRVRSLPVAVAVVWIRLPGTRRREALLAGARLAEPRLRVALLSRRPRLLLAWSRRLAPALPAGSELPRLVLPLTGHAALSLIRPLSARAAASARRHRSRLSRLPGACPLLASLVPGRPRPSGRGHGVLPARTVSLTRIAGLLRPLSLPSWRIWPRLLALGVVVPAVARAARGTRPLLTRRRLPGARSRGARAGTAYSGHGVPGTLPGPVG
jgi:hypothetical protein